MKNYFLDLPIYRCSEEKFIVEREELEFKIRDFSVNNKRLLNEEEYEKLVKELFYLNTYFFDYNEIIGWLKFYVEGNQIRGDWFYECSKGSKKIKERFRRGIRKKQFGYREDVFIFYVDREDSSKIIYEKLLLELKKINRLKFKRRYFDLEILENLGEFIDFRGLLNSLNPYNNIKS